jgi:hypothetical protein
MTRSVEGRVRNKGGERAAELVERHDTEVRKRRKLGTLESDRGTERGEIGVGRGRTKGKRALAQERG